MISVARMRDGEKVSLVQTFSVPMPKGYDAAEAAVDVRFDGSVTKVGSDFLLEGQAAVSSSAACARCLRDVPIAVSFSVEERFCETPGDDVWPIAEHAIDILSVLTDNLLPQWPVKTLCAEDCKGLCRKCGKDLNQGGCGCTEDEGDERLAVLKQWFSDEDLDKD